MPSPDTDRAFALPRHTKVLLVMDVVESVRLMEQDEDGFVQRWRHIVGQTQQRLLPLHGGRIVKSLGDGLMLEFSDAASCIKTALALQDINRALASDNVTGPRLQLRMGAHLADFVADEHDIYGAGVNLTARITTLAGPDEIVVTAALRDQLTAGLDADIEDLGECHLKHVKEPVRAYRVGPVGHAPVIPAVPAEKADFRPTIAVIPFEARSNEPEHFVIGELIADGVIAQLSRNPDIRVISRLSTTAFRGRPTAAAELEHHLSATFVLSGSYVASGGKILLTIELADTRKDQVVWADRMSGAVLDLLEVQSELISRISSAAARALVDTEVQQSLVQPLPLLDSCSLMMGGIAHMHRSSSSDFDRSRQVLEALIERHNRAAAPRAWLAKWHIMRVVRGMSDSPDRDSLKAIEQTKRALDLEPRSTLALAIQGHALCQLSGDAEASLEKINQSIELNPNESLAWLYKSVWSSMWGSPHASVEEAVTAAGLSPLDPLKYYYDLMLASGMATNGEYDQAIALAQRSLKANANHQPTLRVLMFSQAQANRLDDARLTLARLLKQNPNFSVSGYLAMGGGQSVLRQQVAAVLRLIGTPEN